MQSNHFTTSGTEIGARQQCGRSAAMGWALLSLVCLLLVSCASSVGASGTTSQPTPTTPNIPISKTPQLTQQYDFTAQDSGKTVTYVITSRFEIILDQQKYPKQHVQVSCTPSDALGSVSNLPYVAPPQYVVRYETVQPGVCTIKNGTFLLTVKIIALQD
jgi:hypothetical protein